MKSKKATADLSTEYLKGILANIVQGILFIDLHGVINTYNKAAESILDIPSEKVLFHSFWDVFQDEQLGFSMREALEKKISLKAHCLSYLSPNDLHCEIEINTTFILKDSEEDSMQGMIVMIKDVTELRQLQTIANRTSRMKELGEMAALVAHEIRNPLGGIKGFASLLYRDLATQPTLQDMAGHIVAGTDELNSLVSQVLDYARPLHPRLEPHDLLVILQEAKKHILADVNLNTSSIDIAVNSPHEELWVAIDIPLFKSALLNLLLNAIQAMPKGGKIEMKATKRHDYAILTLTDTGLGISEEHIARLYSPFFTTKPSGNGLGLVEVQKVVQAHHGTIDVSSIVGQGTSFVIKLPLSQRNT